MNLKNFLRYYLFLIVLFILSGFILMPVNAQTQACVSFKPFKMIFLPDTHISFKAEKKSGLQAESTGLVLPSRIPVCGEHPSNLTESDDWILYKESFVIFQDVIKNIKAIPDLNFVVFGGDLTNNDDNELSDLPLFLDSIEDVNFKYYAILGDREADLKAGYTKQDFCAEFRRNGFDNPDLTYWAQQPQDNVLLIGLDTSVDNKVEGKLPPEELLWLDNTLKSNPDKFTIIVMHHPAFQTKASDKTIWKRFALDNSDEFLNIINKYPQVKLVLSGHHHNYAVKNIAGKLFISLPSVVTYPNQYKILKIYPDKVEIENKDITFKQITKEAKNSLIKTDYAKEFDSKNPKNVLKFQRGDEFFKQKVFYF